MPVPKFSCVSQVNAVQEQCGGTQGPNITAGKWGRGKEIPKLHVVCGVRSVEMTFLGGVTLDMFDWKPLHSTRISQEYPRKRLWVFCVKNETIARGI